MAQRNGQVKLHNNYGVQTMNRLAINSPITYTHNRAGAYLGTPEVPKCFACHNRTRALVLHPCSQDAHTCPCCVLSTGPHSWQRNYTFCSIFAFSIYMISLTSLVTVATIPDVHCRFCSQILCKYKCTHLAMKLHILSHFRPLHIHVFTNFLGQPSNNSGRAL